MLQSTYQVVKSPHPTSNNNVQSQNTLKRSRSALFDQEDVTQHIDKRCKLSQAYKPSSNPTPTKPQSSTTITPTTTNNKSNRHNSLLGTSLKKHSSFDINDSTPKASDAFPNTFRDAFADTTLDDYYDNFHDNNDSTNDIYDATTGISFSESLFSKFTANTDLSQQIESSETDILQYAGGDVSTGFTPLMVFDATFPSFETTIQDREEEGKKKKKEERKKECENVSNSEILKLRLKVAVYKVLTGQLYTPFTRLKIYKQDYNNNIDTSKGSSWRDEDELYGFVKVTNRRKSIDEETIVNGR